MKIDWALQQRISFYRFVQDPQQMSKIVLLLSVANSKPKVACPTHNPIPNELRGAVGVLYLYCIFYRISLFIVKMYLGAGKVVSRVFVVWHVWQERERAVHHFVCYA